MSSTGNFKHLPAGLVLSSLVALCTCRFVGLATLKSDLLSGVDYASKHFADFSSAGMPLLAVNSISLAFACMAFCIVLMYYFRWTSKGTFRRGEEHGSARWATVEEMMMFGDPDVSVNNVLLSKDVKLRYQRGNDYMHERNRNIAIIGGSGAGKTRGYVKPNLMQIPSEENGKTSAGNLSLVEQNNFARSFLVTDPKGVTCPETGHLLVEHGYELKVFDTIDFDNSLGYNPMKYIRSEEDVMSFTTCLIKNTTPEDANKSGDPFWENSEKLLYQALINYMMTEVAAEDRNLVTLCDLLDLGEVDEGSSAMSGLDILFAELETGKVFNPDASDAEGSNRSTMSMWTDSPQAVSRWSSVREPQPNHPAVLAYRSFKSGAVATLQSILISCKVRLAFLRTKRIRRIIQTDEMELDRFGEKKMACFAIVSATDPTYNCLFALLIWQMINELTRRGTAKYKAKGGALPIGVDLILDEFANFYVPNFQTTISVIRSYNISAQIILQSLSQLKEKYGDENSNTIINNCDSMVFLGGKDSDTTKELEELIGQQTVTTDNTSDSHAEKNSWTQTIAQHGRALMQSSEIAKMPRDHCLVLIQGSDPFYGRKTDVTDHAMYDWIDPGKGRRFDSIFDFAAFTSNPRYYYEKDCSLSVDVDFELYRTTPLSVVPARERTYTVMARATVRNSGSNVAYNLKGMAEFDVSCDMLDDFPRMQPFNTASGLRFTRADTFSNMNEFDRSSVSVTDVIEYSDAQGFYEIHGADILPDKPVIYSTSLSVSASTLYEKMGGSPDERKDCVFRFDYSIELTSANGGAVSCRKSAYLVARSDNQLVSLDSGDGSIASGA